MERCKRNKVSIHHPSSSFKVQSDEPVIKFPYNQSKCGFGMVNWSRMDNERRIMKKKKKY